MMLLESPVQLRPAIAHWLSQYAARQRALKLLRAVGAAIVVAIVWLTIWGVIDRFLIAIPSSGRLFLLIVLILLEARVVRQALKLFLRREVNWLAIASQIEANEPAFDEALLTVVSESLLAPQNRASSEMAARLADQVELEIGGRPAPASPPAAPARFATGIAAAGLAIFISLFFWPRLGMEELVARQILPIANLAPVKTTHLSVRPGSVDVPQGDPLPIMATVEQLRGSTVILRTTTDNRNWVSVGMTPLGNGVFTHTLPAISRDLTFQVAAGDALSDRAYVRVLRPPLVRNFRIQLSYPKYVPRDPLTLTNTDGMIQAPIGTRATIEVTATEPLSSATFIIDGVPMQGKSGPDPHTRQVEFTVGERDVHWQLNMTSDRFAPGAGPGDMLIHAIPDRAPIARLLLPQRSLFLRPRDSVRIAYEAADDFALEKVEARVTVNGGPALVTALAMGADPQHVQNSFDLDLSKYNVSIGDLVSVMIAATDRADQTTQADPCEILVASQSVTAEQRRRVAQLRQANQLASAIAADLDAVPSSAGESKQANSQISSACESAALLIQALLRADSQVQDPQLAGLFSALADAAAIQSARLDQLSARIGTADLSMDSLPRQREDARKLQSQIQALWQGLSSEVVIAERSGLDAAPAQTAASLASLREDVGAELHDLGIDPQTAPVAAELGSRIALVRQLIGASDPIDFAQAAGAWAASKDPVNELLPERLSIAAQAEAICACGDVQWALDLQLAARAARAIDDRQLQSARTSLAQAMAAIQEEHRAGSSIAEPAADSNRQNIRAAALTARRTLRALAGEPQLFASTRPAEGDASSNSSPRSAATTQQIDTREQMLAAIRQAQEDLAELPLLLGRIEQSVQTSRHSLNVARQAERDALAAPADARDVARRAAEIALVQSDQDFESLSEIDLKIDPNLLHEMIRDLQSFGVDALPAATIVSRRVEPALSRVRERIDARDPDGIDQAIVEARDSLSAAQDELRRARKAVLDKDPLVAARWFDLRKASVVGPASQPAATQPRNETPGALGLAWEDSLRRATEARLAAGPATRPSQADDSLFGLFEPNNSLRPWLDSDLGAETGARDDDPPQFKDALHAYFKVLGRPDSDAEP